MTTFSQGHVGAKSLWTTGEQLGVLSASYHDRQPTFEDFSSKVDFLCLRKLMDVFLQSNRGHSVYSNDESYRWAL